MAYLKKIWSKCDEAHCTASAVVSLHSWRNETIGQFCRRHGSQRLAVLKRLEAKEAEVR